MFLLDSKSFNIPALDLLLQTNIKGIDKVPQ